MGSVALSEICLAVFVIFQTYLWNGCPLINRKHFIYVYRQENIYSIVILAYYILKRYKLFEINLYQEALIGIIN